MAMTVTLREVHDDDLKTLYEHQADPASGAMAGVEARDWEGFLAHQARVRANPESLQRVIVLEGGDVVGDIATWRTESGAREIGYRIDRRHWGRGIATAALAAFVSALDERPLYAHVLKTNASSIRVLEKCGFVPLPAGHEQDDDPETFAYVLS